MYYYFFSMACINIDMFSVSKLYSNVSLFIDDFEFQKEFGLNA